MIGIINYDSGNTKSVQNALDRMNVPYCLSDQPAELDACEKIIFPGVGAAGAAMQTLHQKNLVDWIKRCQKPFLGICLGMQLLFEHSAEDSTACLGIIAGNTQKFKPNKKVPHMGWNNVFTPNTNSKTTDYYYFVHSFFVPVNTYTTLACQYQDETFSAAVQKDNFWGVQFHPEKSSTLGQQLLADFINTAQ